MCRFVVYLGPEITVSSLVTEPSHSLINQSFNAEEREEPLNGDGFGVAWYAHAVSETPAVFKDISPAWNNQNLLNVARVVRSDCILAHVRAASSGLPVTQLNCHPFVWEELAFMHNGDLGGFREMRRPIIERLSDDAFAWVKGSTDSEHIFALFIDNYSKTPGDGATKLEGAMRATIETLRDLRTMLKLPTDAFLNLAVTDGHAAVISRIASPGEDPESLYYIGGRQYDCVDGVCMMRPGSSAAVVVASEPLSGDEGWAQVPANHLVTIEHRQPRLSECTL
jgi:ergothioneine biosynthesis protein EgtC